MRSYNVVPITGEGYFRRMGAAPFTYAGYAQVQKEKPAVSIPTTGFGSSGRGEKIRTSDPLHPMQVRYQAALRPDKLRIISE